MQSNPIRQRVRQLEELWSEFAFRNDYAEARIMCWMGSSMVDYRMIKGFVMVQMSDEAGLADTFMCNHLVFQKGNAGGYGRRLVSETQKFIESYNADKSLHDEHGPITWTATPDHHQKSDAEYFADNFNSLAPALKVQEGEEFLVLALLPEPNFSPNDYSEWLEEVLKAGLSASVRIMIYDTYGTPFYERLEKKYQSQFKRLYPDLDMPGAMGQIAEQAESTATTPEDKDLASFQKNLLKMNTAISQTDMEAVETFRTDCLSIAKRRSWPHMEALVSFFAHTFFYAKGDHNRAHEELSRAIQKSDEAHDLKIVDEVTVRCQYRIAKGNLYFFKKEYDKAATLYQESIQISDSATSPLDIMTQMGILQMLGMCLYKDGSKTEARDIFERGWVMACKDPDTLHDNKVLMYYAQQMMEAGMHKQAAYGAYFQTMEEVWGRDWHKKLETYQKELKHEYT